jgi:drug/metabolite transporter (DMT)-like permease
VAAVALFVFLPAARRGFRRDLVPAALAYAATVVAFVTATKWTTAAAAIFLQSTAPIWVVLLSPLLLGERVRRRDLPFLALAGAGLVLVFFGSGDPAATAPRPALGNGVALASGLFYALLMITFRRLARVRDAPDRSLPATVLGNAVASLVCLPFCFPVVGARPADALAIGYLGVVQIGLAYWLFVRGLAHLSALEVSLLVLVEPVLNPLWTWLLHDERPTALALAGGAVMLAALAARALLDRSGPAAAEAHATLVNPP